MVDAVELQTYTKGVETYTKGVEDDDGTLKLEQEHDDTHHGPSLGICMKPDGELEYKQHGFWRQVLVEFWATFMFLFFTIGTVNSTGLNAAVANVEPNNGNGLDNARQLMIAMTFGLSIYVLVYITASVSGGNINPAVTVMCLITKRMGPIRAVMYIIAQMFGAAAGAGVIKAIMPADRFNNAVNGVADGWGDGAAFFGEFFATSLLIMAVMTAIDPNVARPGKPGFLTAQAPGAIGWSVCLAHFLLIPITNCGINPARSFGASLVSDTWDDQWLFWVAPLLAAVVFAVAYELLLKDRK